ncbi:response regulator transcription factor [Streptomonospora sp. PA3]|uniref:response regulator transcription factor n=1 Tax=Streptomonospora sp. PA3 TaxID=2607326 RepID=UPI0012DF145F|nr:response regulator transcription factor [Streptomonospora sp. PA3]MUL43055.1 response regulator transcription factor [Streptomonospora sp. PA3]
MRTTETFQVVRGEEEVLRRTAHLFQAATDFACAANSFAAWTWAHAQRGLAADTAKPAGMRIRKLYRSGMLLDPTWAQRIAEAGDRHGAQIRVSTEEMNETIILDGRVVILAGDEQAGERSYSLISQPETVQGVCSLFEIAWRSATELAVYDARVAEVRQIAPRVLDLLGQGVKDEAAARMLGLGVRTYRRRVAELMAALGAESRFQAGLRARELGLV